MESQNIIGIEISRECSKKEFLEVMTHIPVYNSIRNKFDVYYDKNFSELVTFNNIQQFLSDTFSNQNFIEFYAKVKNICIKFKIESSEWGNFIFLKPLQPYKLKTNEEKIVDLSFYSELALQLCENFVIYIFKADINGVSIDTFKEELLQ